jgi:hypothetical protein
MAASVERDYQLVLVSGGRGVAAGRLRPAGVDVGLATSHGSLSCCTRGDRAREWRGIRSAMVSLASRAGDDLVVQQGQVRESRVPVRLLALQVGRGADL